MSVQGLRFLHDPFTAKLALVGEVRALERFRDEGAQRVDRRLAFVAPAQTLCQRVELRRKVGEDDVLLRGEVAEERAWRDVRRLGDVGDRGLLEASLVE